ncbi:hypothetical protein [Yersinia similis]|nr:hypothetical protein [Yersinia similis]
MTNGRDINRDSRHRDTEQVVHDFDANSGIRWSTLEAALGVVQAQSR